MMKNYIKLKDYPKYMEVQNGDIIFISSDAKIMLWEAYHNHAETNLNRFIDGLIEAVGEDGTIIFPTYNWDFCSGTTFDFNHTPCKTGTLGAIALGRDDFQRTKHPIYSFAVYGKYKKYLCELENIDSFGMDSPFAFFKEHNVKNYIIDVTLQNCFTYAHFVEEQSGVVNYRYIKYFSAEYIDENGNRNNKKYSMFVRNLDLNVETLIDPIEEDFLKSNAETVFQINSSMIKCIYLGNAYEIILDDIKCNRSKKLCSFIGQ